MRFPPGSAKAGSSRAAALRLVVALALSPGLAGCGLAMSEFSRPMGEMTGPGPAAAAAPTVPPAATVVATDAASGGGGERSGPGGGAYPNINVVPPEPKSKLLTPDETAKVIAELEALAQSQGAATERAYRAAAKDECSDEVFRNLDAAARHKLEQDGVKC